MFDCLLNVPTFNQVCWLIFDMFDGLIKGVTSKKLINYEKINFLGVYYYTYAFTDFSLRLKV